MSDMSYTYCFTILFFLGNSESTEITSSLMTRELHSVARDINFCSLAASFDEEGDRRFVSDEASLSVKFQFVFVDTVKKMKIYGFCESAYRDWKDKADIIL